MPAPQGTVHFPGVLHPISAEYTRGHGITPGVCTLECAPQESPVAEGGTLQFTFGSVVLSFPGCRIDRASLRRDSRGRIVSLSILDRRWRWAFRSISGRWNQRVIDARIAPDRERTPRQLAAILLAAMGEVGYTITDLPDDVRPAVDWDRANPAQELAQLADECGCRVVLRLDDTVLLAPLGIGAALPGGAIIDMGQESDPPERPDTLALYCAPSQWQMDFALEPVGEELTGEILPINLLSYRPAAGWLKETPPFFAGVAVGRARDLAKQHIWRSWRPIVLTLQGDPLDVPGFGIVHDLRQILPLGAYQIEQISGAGGWPEARPAEIYGSYYDGGLGSTNTTLAFGTTPRTTYRGTVSIDQERGLLKASDCIFSLGAGGIEYPQLYARTAVTIRDRDTLAYSRYRRAIDYLPAWGTGERPIVRDEPTYQVVLEYDQFGTVVRSTHNEERVIQEADYILAAVNREYQMGAASEATYAGLVPIDLDGAIQSVSWRVGGGGPAITRASRNGELSTVSIPYGQRRSVELSRDAEAKQQRGRLDQMMAQWLRQRGPWGRWPP